MCHHCVAMSAKAGLCPTCAEKNERAQSRLWQDERFRVALLAVAALLLVLVYIFPKAPSKRVETVQHPVAVSRAQGVQHPQLITLRPVPELAASTAIVTPVDVTARCTQWQIPVTPWRVPNPAPWPPRLPKAKRERVDLAGTPPQTSSLEAKKPPDLRRKAPISPAPQTQRRDIPTPKKTDRERSRPTNTAAGPKVDQPQTIDAGQLRQRFLGNDPLTKYHMDGIPSQTQWIVLTFDGNFMANCVDPILSVLADKKVHANFFLTGFFVTHFPRETRRILDAGHEIGNHTWSHPRLTTYEKNKTHRTRPGVTREFIAQELRKTADAFRQLTGEDLHPFWRAPYGEHNRQIRTWAYAEGFFHIGWSSGMDSIDWLGNPKSRYYWRPQELKSRLLKHLDSANGTPGKIILFHLGSVRPDEDRPFHMLAAFIDEARSRGFTFATVGQVLHANRRIQTSAKMGRDAVPEHMGDSGNPIGK